MRVSVSVTIPLQAARFNVKTQHIYDMHTEQTNQRVALDLPSVKRTKNSTKVTQRTFAQAFVGIEMRTVHWKDLLEKLLSTRSFPLFGIIRKKICLHFFFKVLY